MKISKVVLNNFRGFEHKEFLFNPSITVAIGNNGSGKSTLLHALQIATGTFFLGLPYVFRRHIHEDEIRATINPISSYLNYFTPTYIETTGYINGSGEFIWRREIPEYGKSTSSKKSDVGKIREIAERYAKSIHNPDRPQFPVIAFFGVKQMGTNVAKWVRTKSKRDIIKKGYYNALGQKSDESAFIEWFYDYDENFAANSEVKGTREAVFFAIEKAIPFLKNVSFDRHYFQFVADVELDGQPSRRLLHHYMSDGIKRMLGIVADVAYRCAILNGHLGVDAVLKSEGVVLIDELDMHLHPNWQRRVVADLKNAFPEIQFVVTTHSPFIVQSITVKSQLINLDNPPTYEPKLEKAASNYGLEDTVEGEMAQDVQRSEVFKKRTQIAEKYFDLISKGKTSKNDTEVLELKKDLDRLEDFFTDDPIYLGQLRSERKLYKL